jgi:hypothetical protein
MVFLVILSIIIYLVVLLTKCDKKCNNDVSKVISYQKPNTSIFNK